MLSLIAQGGFNLTPFVTPDTAAETLLLYALAGLGVAGAVYLTDSGHHAGERWFRVLSAVVFWPLLESAS